MRLQIISCVSSVVSIDGIIEYVRNANYVLKWYLSNQSSRQQGKYILQYAFTNAFSWKGTAKIFLNFKFLGESTASHYFQTDRVLLVLKEIRKKEISWWKRNIVTFLSSHCYCAWIIRFFSDSVFCCELCLTYFE